MPLTCGARSTVNVDQLTVNTDWVSNGLRRPSGWAGLGRAGPDMWQAVALPRHGRGPLLGFIHSSRAWAWLTVDQVVLVNGPKVGSPVDQVHRHLPRLGSCAPGARLRCSTCPFSSVLPRRASASDVLTSELPQRLKHPIEVGKSLPMPWRLQWWSQGDGWGILSHWSR